MADQLLDTDEKVVGALLYLYNRQTPDEQLDAGTKHDNEAGFNGPDSGIMTSFAEQYINKGRLSDKQIKLARSKLAKYRGQLADGDWEPLPVNTYNKTQSEPVQNRRRAEMSGSDKIAARWEYDDPDFKAIKGRISGEVNGRRFIKTPQGDKYWEVPLSVPNVELLTQFGFVLDENISGWYKQQTAELGGIQPENFNGTLMEFQARDLEMIERRNGRVLIANEMGTGKTPLTIAYLALHPELRPALIVVPATLKENWRRELAKFLPQEPVEVLSGTAPYRVKAPTAIINYDIIKDWQDYWLRNQPAIVVYDEGHALKNSGAKRTKASLKIAEKAQARLPLTGTPIENKPKELMNAVKLVEPELVKNEFQWLKRYAGASHNGFGWDFTGSSNIEELHNRHKHVMIRHTKEGVLKDLPPKRTSVVPIPCSKQGKNKYDKLYRNLDTSKSANHLLADMERLKQAAVQAKWDAALDWLTEFVDEDEKIGIATTHLEPARRLKEHFGEKAVIITGEQSQKERTEAVDAFQNDPGIILMIGQIRAAGLGLNLQAGSNAAFLELDWNPKVHDQFTDRFHRIGTTKSVNCYYLVAEGTIEEDIAEMLDEKRKVADKATDGIDTEDKHLITELMKRIKEGG